MTTDLAASAPDPTSPGETFVPMPPPPDMEAVFANLIVGGGWTPVEHIVNNPLNWRIHPREQQEAMLTVLYDVGLGQTILKNRRTGNLVDGHLRTLIADREGQSHLPYIALDCDEDKELELLITLDPIGAMAATDKVKLDQIIQQAQTDSDRMQMLFEDVRERFLGSDWTLPAQPTEAHYAEHDRQSSDGTHSDHQMNSYRIMQLLVDPAKYDEVMAAVATLSEEYGTENVTDTVVEALIRAGRARTGADSPATT
jgi:hypothetical protein